MPPVYDTYAAVRPLVEARVPEPQAVAHVLEQTQLLADTIATKDDFRALERRVTSLEQRFDDFDKRLTRVEVQMAELRADVRASEARLIKYMVTLAVLIVTLVKLL